MNTDRYDSKGWMDLFQILNESDPDAMRRILEVVYNEVMKIERDHAIGAGPYERTSGRVDYSNGFKPKKFKTRMGTLNLEVPQTRETSFYPSCLEKGCRIDKALMSTISEAYVLGISTRKMKKLTEKMCGHEVSSSQVSELNKRLDEELEQFRQRKLGSFGYVYFDAIYVKIRNEGTVQDLAVLIACGVNEEGKREVMGISASFSEAEVHWRQFMESLVERGLRGVRLITSDSHAGLKAARQAAFPGVKWQRCQFHLSQNALAYARSESLRQEIIRAMREIFSCSDIASAEEAKRRIIERFEKKAPEFVNWFESNVDEGLTILVFPESHRKRIRTSNGMERLNLEIRRRTRQVVLFPNIASAERLISAILLDIHEEWLCGKRYLDMRELE